MNYLNIKDADGINRKVQATLNDESVYSVVNTSIDFNLAVNQGLVEGHRFVDKFGKNDSISPATDPEDVWEGGDIYTYDADGTAPIQSLISTDATDGQVIEITGLDINGDEVIQNITLNGTTRVALTTPLWRVYRMQNEGTTNLAGSVYCYTGTGGLPIPSIRRAVIDNGNNQTLMALYTVPKGYVGFLQRGEIGIDWEGGAFSGTEFARVYYQSRRYGKVFKVKKAVSLISSGSSNFQDVRSAPDVIPALTDTKLTVSEVSAEMGVWATFDVLLVDESQFSDTYLQAIGQPGY